jgi:hypothetical protein
MQRKSPSDTSFPWHIQQVLAAGGAIRIAGGAGDEFHRVEAAWPSPSNGLRGSFRACQRVMAAAVIALQSTGEVRPI